jgi:hypothetical protein
MVEEDWQHKSLERTQDGRASETSSHEKTGYEGEERLGIKNGSPENREEDELERLRVEIIGRHYDYGDNSEAPIDVKEPKVSLDGKMPEESRRPDGTSKEESQDDYSRIVKSTFANGELESSSQQQNVENSERKLHETPESNLYSASRIEEKAIDEPKSTRRFKEVEDIQQLAEHRSTEKSAKLESNHQREDTGIDKGTKKPVRHEPAESIPEDNQPKDAPKNAANPVYSGTAEASIPMDGDRMNKHLGDHAIVTNDEAGYQSPSSHSSEFNQKTDEIQMTDPTKSGDKWQIIGRFNAIHLGEPTEERRSEHGIGEIRQVEHYSAPEATRVETATHPTSGPRPEHMGSNERVELPMRPMNAKERAVWFDTEGSLYVSPTDNPLKKSVAIFSIAQSSRQPLEDFKEGAALDGINCRIIQRVKGEQSEYRLVISGLEDISKELVREAPYLRTVQKQTEVGNFRSYLARERDLTKSSVESARRLLDSLEEPLPIIRRPMDSLERANWFDTEGCLSVSRNRRHSRDVSMFVAQSQREPLEDFAIGAGNDGVDSTIFYRRRISDEYEVRIRRIDHIARELSLEVPFLRTQDRAEQIQRFKKFLGEPRKKLKESVRQARDILDTPSGS